MVTYLEPVFKIMNSMERFFLISMCVDNNTMATCHQILRKLVNMTFHTPYTWVKEVWDHENTKAWCPLVVFYVFHCIWTSCDSHNSAVRFYKVLKMSRSSGKPAKVAIRWVKETTSKGTLESFLLSWKRKRELWKYKRLALNRYWTTTSRTWQQRYVQASSSTTVVYNHGVQRFHVSEEIPAMHIQYKNYCITCFSLCPIPMHSSSSTRWGLVSWGQSKVF